MFTSIIAIPFFKKLDCAEQEVNSIPKSTKPGVATVADIITGMSG
ncbi:MAG: hypothetical protein OXD01_16150 [Gammaproteobacteria bacterium]|nr:hypothetical protein [Gammaproteobacteria bacterium]